MLKLRNVLVIAVIVLGTAALVVAGVAALNYAEEKRADATQIVPPDRGVAVGVATATQRDARLDVTVSGFLDAFEEITISAQIPGFVQIQHVEVSDRVDKGKTLFEMDASLREVDLKKANAVAARAQAEFDLANEDVKRIQRLNTQGSTNPREVLLVDTAHATAKAMLDQAVASVDEAEILLGKTIITAPFAGHVARVHTRQGEYAHAGQPIVDLIDMDRLKLIVQLNDRQVVAFAPQDPVTMRASARPSRKFDGRILRIHPSAAIDSRMFEIEIEIPNPEHSLRPGFFVTAELAQQDSSGSSPKDVEVLTIPRTAVFERYRQQYCFVVRSAEGESVERAYLTPLRTAPFLADMKTVQVLAGIQPGDRVITTGLLHATHEAIVRVSER